MAIKKIIVNNVVNMDVSQDTVTENTLLNTYTAHKSDGTQITGTYVPPTIAVIEVNFTYDGINDTWTPNKTYTELRAAFENYIPIVTTAPAFTTAEVQINGYQIMSSSEFEVYIAKSFYDESSNTAGMDIYSYLHTSSGFNLQYKYRNYDTYDADAIASDVLNGKVVYTSSGKTIGTAIAPIPILQSKTVSVTPTESAQTQTVSPDNGYDALSSVTVNTSAISNMYIGSGVARRDGNSLYINTSTGLITIPSGYYPLNAMGNPPTRQLDVQSGTTITPSTSQQTAVAAGKYTTGAVLVDAIPSGTVTAPASISDTSASVSTGTNTITLSKTVSVTPSVSTAGYVSAGTAGDSAVSLTASVTTKAAATITPGTSDQTIAAGTYLTGDQTIAGDADLVGSNILSTANIFGVQGTVTFQTYYTGASAPSSSVGVDGDVWLQT